MAQVGNLEAKFGVDVAPLTSGLDRARQALQSQSRVMNTAIAKLDRGYNNFNKRINNSLKGMLNLNAAIGTVAGTAGLGLLISKSLSAADAIGKAADSANFSVERFQSLTFAAEQSGVAASQFEDGVRRLNRRLGLFRQGGGPAAAAFKELGLAAEISNGQIQNAEQLFDAAIKKLQGYEDQAVKAALASQLFGEDSGPKLALLVEKGADGVKALEDKAVSLGIVIREDLIRSSENAKDKFDQLASVLKSKMIVAVVENADKLEALAENLINKLPAAMETAGSVASKLADNFLKIAVVLGVIVGAKTGAAIGGGAGGLPGLGIGAGVGAVVGGGGIYGLIKALEDFTSAAPGAEGKLESLRKKLADIEALDPRARRSRKETADNIREQISLLEEQIKAAEKLRSTQFGGGDEDGETSTQNAAQKEHALTEELRRQVQQRERLLNALKLGEEQYAKTLKAIEAEDAILAASRAGVGEATGAYAQLFRQKQELESQTETIIEANKREADAFEKEQERMRQAAKESAEFIPNAFERAFDRVGNTITDAIARGEGSLLSLSSIGKAVAADLAQSFLQLAATNPLKNSLLGTSNPTLSSVSASGGAGGGGGGGFLGGLSTLGGLSNFLPGSVTGAFGGALSGVNSFLFGQSAVGALGPQIPTSGLLGSGGNFLGIQGGLGGVLGAAGAGSIAGLGASLLGLGNQNALINSAGSALGGIAGTALLAPILGPLAPFVGGFAGSTLSGLFGPGESVGPNAGGQLRFSGDRFVVGPTGADNGGDISGIEAALSNAAQALNALVELPDFSIAASKTFGGDKNPIAGFIDTFGSGGVRNADDLVRDVIGKGVIAGLTDDETKRILGSQNVGQGIADVLNIRQGRQPFLDDLRLSLLDITNPRAAALERANSQFDALEEQAKTFNVFADAIGDIDKLRDLRIAEIIGQFGDAANDNAEALSAAAIKLKQVESQLSSAEQNLLSRQSNLQNFFAGVRSPLEGLRNSLLLGGASPLSAADRFGLAQQNFRGLAEQALTLDARAVSDLPAFAQTFIEQAGLFGASPLQSSATAEVIGVLDNVLAKVNQLQAANAQDVGDTIRVSIGQQTKVLVDELRELRSAVDSLRAQRDDLQRDAA